MASPAYFRSPTIQTLKGVLEEVHTGQILVPMFQRDPFVWQDEQRLMLLDSIYQGFPIGSLMIWRTTRDDIAAYEHLGIFPMNIPEFREGEVRQYLLDGHQRLSTLYMAIGVGLAIKESGGVMPEPDAELQGSVRWPIYFDLEGKTFVFHRRGSSPPATYLPMHCVLDSYRFFEFQRELDDRKLGNFAESVVTRFRDYTIPIIPMATDELDQVIKSFQRVNSQGTSMSEVHMITALSYKTDFDLNERLTQVKEGLTLHGWGDFDEKYILYVLKDVLGLKLDESAERTSKALLESGDALQQAQDSLSLAAECLARVGDVFGPKVLPSAYQAVVLAGVLRDVEASDALDDFLHQWFWYTTYSEQFSGVSFNVVQKHLEALRLVVKKEVPSWSDSPYSDLIKPFEVGIMKPFRFNSVRTRAVALQMARCHDEAMGQTTEARELVGQQGNDAFFVPFSSKTFGLDVEHRFIVPVDERRAFKTKLLGQWDETFCQAHLLPKEWKWHGMCDEDAIESMLALRRRRILHMELEKVEAIDDLRSSERLRKAAVEL